MIGQIRLPMMQGTADEKVRELQEIVRDLVLGRRADDYISVVSVIGSEGAGGGGGGTVTSVAGGVGITNTPEPITGAGTVDLDINSLTTETAPVSGDLFPFLDISVGTAPSAQRKVTLGNIGTALGTHPQSHVLATGTGLGPDHTMSGAAAGEVLRALSATTAAFDVLSHSDLGGVTANQHHNQSHVLATTAGLGADHTTSGLTAGQYLRATGATTAAFQTIPFGDLPAIDHGLLTGLADDDHAQYLLLAGRAAAANNPILSTTTLGELAGSSASGSGLILRSTTHATKGNILLGGVGNDLYAEATERLSLGAGTGALEKLHVVGNQILTEALFGGVVAGDGLDLRASRATNYTGTVDIGKGAGDYDVTDPVCIELWGDGLTYGVVAALNAIRMASTMTQAANASFGLPFINLFRDAHIHKGSSSSITDYNIDNTFAATPVILNDTTAVVASGGALGLLFNPDLRETAAGSLAGLVLTGVQTQIREGAGTAITVSSYKGLNILGASGPGTISITDFIGVDVANIAPAPTGLNVAFRSVGPSEMRHVGSAVFGANLGASNASTGLELSSTTKAFLPSQMTTAQRDALTPLDGMVLYNSTAATHQGRRAGTWVDIPGAGGSVAISSAAIAFTDGDTYRRVTITDGAIGAGAKILAVIRRPDTVDDSADKGYLYTVNVVEVVAGGFDVDVFCSDWGGDDPVDDPPNETVTLLYVIG